MWERDRPFLAGWRLLMVCQGGRVKRPRELRSAPAYACQYCKRETARETGWRAALTDIETGAFLAGVVICSEACQGAPAGVLIYPKGAAFRSA